DFGLNTNQASCVDYTGGGPGGDPAICATLGQTTPAGIGTKIVDVPVPDDAFVTTIFSNASGCTPTPCTTGTGSTQDRINAFEFGPCTPSCGAEGNRTVRIVANGTITDAHFDTTYGTKHTSDKTFTTVITSDGTDANTWASYNLK